MGTNLHDWAVANHSSHGYFDLHGYFNSDIVCARTYNVSQCQFNTMFMDLNWFDKNLMKMHFHVIELFMNKRKMKINSKERINDNIEIFVI